jgi:putative ABC transport system ATP-binding protein
MEQDQVGEAISGQPLVRCEGLSQQYDRGTETGILHAARPGSTLEETPNAVTALDDVTLAVQPGEIVGLSGPSGSGKSTLLHAIAGLLDPTDGTIEFRGNDLTNCSKRRRSRIRHEHVGLVFQQFHLLPSLSARANVSAPLVQAGIPQPERQKRASTLLEQVDLADRATHRPAALSGGEQQRVAIARALVSDPAVVLADEPTGELDTETGRRVLDVLADAASDRTIVLASHDENALAIADRIVRLRDGTVIDDGR